MRSTRGSASPSPYEMSSCERWSSAYSIDETNATCEHAGDVQNLGLLCGSASGHSLFCVMNSLSVPHVPNHGACDGRVRSGISLEMRSTTKGGLSETVKK